jgi:hypothetical protein
MSKDQNHDLGYTDMMLGARFGGMKFSCSRGGQCKEETYDEQLCWDTRSGSSD